MTSFFLQTEEKLLKSDSTLKHCKKILMKEPIVF